MNHDGESLVPHELKTSVVIRLDGGTVILYNHDRTLWRADVSGDLEHGELLVELVTNYHASATHPILGGANPKAVMKSTLIK